jgi:isocitrate lyase
MTQQTKNNSQNGFAVPDYAADRWKNIKRNYTAEDVLRLKGSVEIKHSLAERGAQRLWKSLQEEGFVASLGAFTGNQAIQQVKAGLRAIYLSGWQVAADANNAGQMYPDQSLYPADSVPSVVTRINKALLRADEIQTMEKLQGIADDNLDYLAPIIADAEAGFGGVLNAFELMKAMIAAGAAGVHFEDQLAAEKKCGHLGGKVLIPTSSFIKTLNSARLAADVMGVPSLVIARTDAEAARLITSDIDESDHEFLTGERTAEGFYRLKEDSGLDFAIKRAIAYAPYADLVWCETGVPDLAQARKFAEAVKKVHPDQMLAYNCSPSFNWAKHMGKADLAKFQTELNAMGYKFQFVTLAGFHSLNMATFDLAYNYNKEGMAAYSELQEREFAAEEQGYTATKHQREVGTSYFDAVTTVINGAESSTTAMAGSTETAQF